MNLFGNEQQLEKKKLYTLVNVSDQKCQIVRIIWNLYNSRILFCNDFISLICNGQSNNKSKVWVYVKTILDKWSDIIKKKGKSDEIWNVIK